MHRGVHVWVVVGPRRYDAIVFGDPFCTLTSPPPEIAAAASRWGPAVEGNVILVAGDPAWHAQPAVTQTFIEYAAHDGRTGLYVGVVVPP